MFIIFSFRLSNVKIFQFTNVLNSEWFGKHFLLHFRSILRPLLPCNIQFSTSSIEPNGDRKKTQAISVRKTSNFCFANRMKTHFPGKTHPTDWTDIELLVKLLSFSYWELFTENNNQLWAESVFVVPFHLRHVHLYLYFHCYTHFSDAFGLKINIRPPAKRSPCNGIFFYYYLFLLVSIKNKSEREILLYRFNKSENIEWYSVFIFSSERKKKNWNDIRLIS